MTQALYAHMNNKTNKQTKAHHKKRAEGVAQGEDPEFKP
jgi:hypothetical protein